MTTLGKPFGEISGPSRVQKVVSGFIVVAGFLSVILAAWWYSDDPTVRVGIVVAVFASLITIDMITVSFHRQLTHRAFKLPRWLTYPFAILGSFSLEGGVIRWCAYHRKHHTYSDQEGDPHSPHGFGRSAWGVVRGFIHAHLGWLFTEKEIEKERWTPDLLKDRGLVLIDKLFPLWAVLSFVIPGLVSYALLPEAKSFWMGVLWGGFVRVFFVHHLTWSINSICHMWGTRPFKAEDQSVNNPIFGILGFGEGWHNNHHAFLKSARIGLRFWEIDLGWYTTILPLKWLGLATEVVVPTPKRLLEKRRTPPRA